MSEIDRYLDGEIVSLAIRNGWSYDSKTVTNMRENLKARGFFINEAKEIVSPGDESFGSAIGELWGEPAPGATPAPTVAAAPMPGGFSKADFESLSPQRQAELKIGAGEPPTPFWLKGRAAPVSVAEITQRTGLSAEAFAALPIERRLEITDEVKFSRGVQS